MFSKPAPDRHPSLTARMAVMFGLMTCLIVAIYGIWSGYYFLRTMSDDFKAFLDHEVEELALNVEASDRSPEAIQQCAETIASVTEDPDGAFRVRDRAGVLIAEAGPRRLLAAAPDPVPMNESWRTYFFSRGIAIEARPVGDTGLTVEIIVDASRAEARVRRFLYYAALLFLVSVGMAGVAGWFTARRGLRGLREVVARAGAIDSPEDVLPIHLENAPAEVHEVGVALNSMIQRIQHEMEDMRAFTAGLAHELRSPLQNLIGETEVTLMTERPADDYRTLLKSNLEDLYDLTDAVDNLVAYCRGREPDRGELHAEEFDLAEEAGLRIGREQRTARRAGVVLEQDSEGDTALNGDREACLRVVRNLIGNAIAWSPPGATVRVRFFGAREDVSIIVEDEGPGVQESLRPRIFEPFVTGQLRVGKRGGYGLGLAICRGVVEQHGGSIEYEPREVGGSRFIARFPRNPERGESPARHVPEPTGTPA